MLAAAATAGAFSSPAVSLAQTAQSFDDRLFRLPNFPIDRQQAVSQRRTPGFAATPLRVGPVDVLPAATLAPIYIDNIYATRARRVDDLVLNARARVDVGYDTPTLMLSLAGLVDAREYLGRQRESTTDYEVGGTAKIVATKLSGFEFGGAHAKHTLQRFAPDALDDVARPVRYLLNDAYGQFGGQINRLRVVARVSLRDYDYHDAPRNRGGIIDQDYRDHDELTASGNAEYAVTPDIAVLLTAARNRRNFRNANAMIERSRDSRGTELAAGARVRVGPTMVGDIRVGRLEQHFRDPIYKDIDAFLVRGRLDYAPTPLISLSATVDRDVVDSAIFRSGSILITSAIVRADYEVLRHFIVSGDVGYNHDRYYGVDRTDKRLTLGLGGRYQLGPKLALEAGYRFRLRDSSGASLGRDYRINTLTVGVSYRGI